MRWLFLLLVVLNVFYYVWHQQEAPLKVNEVHSISVSTDSKRTIQLLKEVQSMLTSSDIQKTSESNEFCTYMAGIDDAEQVRSLALKLASLNLKLVPVTPQTAELDGLSYRIVQEGRLPVAEEVLRELANEFKGLIYKKRRC